MQGGPGNFPLIISFLCIVRKPSEDERSAGKNRAQMKTHLGPANKFSLCSKDREISR